MCFYTLFFLCGSYCIDVYGLNNYFVIKIEFIIYHKEKGRLNISNGLFLKQVLATHQFQTLTRSHSTGIAVPTADIINVNIETVGDGV